MHGRKAGWRADDLPQGGKQGDLTVCTLDRTRDLLFPPSFPSRKVIIYYLPFSVLSPCVACFAPDIVPFDCLHRSSAVSLLYVYVAG